MSSNLRRVEHRSLRTQRGYALLLTVVSLVVVSLTFLTSAIAQRDPQAERDDVTRRALLQAKEALIGRAALDENRPGSLPCPDLDGDGSADAMGTTCYSAGAFSSNLLVGRLPWKTLGLSDLRDGSGERLWYALSRNFTDRDESSPINSNTQGDLRVLGTTPAEETNGVIAIVFAPGAPIGNQNRNADGVNNPSNYLEGANDIANDPLSNDGIFAALPVSPIFNDKLVLVAGRDLFPMVEKAVGARLAQLLRYYRDQWTSPVNPSIGSTRPVFPFATAALPNQAEDNFCGAAPVTSGQISEGLLPVSVAAACVQLTGIIVDPTNRATLESCRPYDPVPDPVGGTDPPLLPGAFAAMTCVLPYQPSPVASGFNINVSIGNAGGSLMLPFRADDIRYGYDDPTFSGVTNVFWTQGLSGGANAHVKYSGTIPPTVVGGTLRIVFPIYSLRSRFPAQQESNWFFENEWYRLTYYAAVPQRLFNASPPIFPCAAGVSCLRVIDSAAPNNNKEAIVIVAGRALPHQNRPTNAPADYWDLENVSAADGIFQRSRTTLQFNDQLSIVSP